MDKKLIRLTESDLHRMVKEAVERILKEGEDFPDYTLPNGGFDSTAYDYDQALEYAKTPEEFDMMMKKREERSKTGGHHAQHWHPQAEPDAKLIGKNKPKQSMASWRSIHSPFTNDNVEKQRENDFRRYGF